MPNSRNLFCRRRGVLRRNAAMTLVEIMIVVIIMAMIAAAVGVAVIPTYRRAQDATAETDTRSVRTAAMNFLMSSPGAPCPDVDTLVEARFLDRGQNVRDPWGHPYAIECRDDEVYVRSAGADGQHGTDDDVP